MRLDSDKTRWTRWALVSSYNSLEIPKSPRDRLWASVSSISPRLALTSHKPQWTSVSSMSSISPNKRSYWSPMRLNVPITEITKRETLISPSKPQWALGIRNLKDPWWNEALSSLNPCKIPFGYITNALRISFRFL